MSAGIAWALTSAFALGFFLGALLAATLIVAVRIKIDTTRSERGEWLSEDTPSGSGSFAKPGAVAAFGRRASTKAR